MCREVLLEIPMQTLRHKTLLFNFNLRTGIYPSQLKVTNIYNYNCSTKTRKTTGKTQVTQANKSLMHRKNLITNYSRKERSTWISNRMWHYITNSQNNRNNT